MPDTMNLHWTDDSDLLAEYAMGRVTEAERKRLDAHLETCLRCREAIDREKSIASGVRRYAREEMKSRLKVRLSARPDSHRGFGMWQRVASAAAVVLIVFGVGLYNRWFPWQERRDLVNEQISEIPEKVSRETGRVEPQFKETEPSTSPQQDRRGTAHGEDVFVGPPSGIERSAQTIAAAPESRVDKADDLGNAQNAKSSSSGVGGDSKKKEVIRDDIQVASAQHLATPVWIEGVRLGTPTITASAQAEVKALSAAQSETPKSEGLLKSGANQREFGMVGAKGDISLHQQLVNDLPFSRQQRQIGEGRVVQAMIEQSGNKLNITIFLDTLFSEEDLGNARVEQARSDSLIIGVGSKVIAFKLPQSVLKMQKAALQNKVR